MGLFTNPQTYLGCRGASAKGIHLSFTPPPPKKSVFGPKSEIEYCIESKPAYFQEQSPAVRISPPCAALPHPTCQQCPWESSPQNFSSSTPDRPRPPHLPQRAFSHRSWTFNPRNQNAKGFPINHQPSLRPHCCHDSPTSSRPYRNAAVFGVHPLWHSARVEPTGTFPVPITVGHTAVPTTGTASG